MGREFRIYLGGGAEVFAGMGTRLGTLKFRAFAHSLSLSLPLSLSLSLSLSLCLLLSITLSLSWNHHCLKHLFRHYGTNSGI